MDILKKIGALSKMYLSYKSKRIETKTLPIRLWVESSLDCNLKCVMCPNKQVPRTEKGVMDFNLYKRIIDESKDFVNDIFLQHRGEPLINPHIFDMIRYAKERGIKVRMHTNGTLLDKDKAKQLIDAQPDLVSFSFDGWQKDIYEEVRSGASFEVTQANIHYLLDIKRAAGCMKPYIAVERIDLVNYRSQINNDEVEIFKSEMRRRGVNELLVKKEFQWMTDDALSCGLKRQFNECTLPWYAMIICYDGTVLPCMQDFLCAYNLGNVKEKSIHEIWNDAPYREFRKKMIAEDPSLHLCVKCDRLCRKQVAGIPYQYLVKFLVDNFVGYGKLRSIIGSHERNDYK